MNFESQTFRQSCIKIERIFDELEDSQKKLFVQQQFHTFLHNSLRFSKFRQSFLENRENDGQQEEFFFICYTIGF